VEQNPAYSFAAEKIPLLVKQKGVIFVYRFVIIKVFNFLYNSYISKLLSEETLPIKNGQNFNY